MRRPPLGSCFGSCLLLLGLASSARPDEVRLQDGQVLGPGTVVAIGPTRLLFDGERSGLVFCERKDVVQVLDANGRPRDWTQAAASETDPVGVVQKLVGNGVRVRRRDEEVPLALHGAQAVVREGDVLRTGPYGRATLALPGGGLLTARSDAMLRFQEGKPVLLEGVLHLEQAKGSLSAWIADGRVEALEGQTVLERLRGRTRLTCLGGRAMFHARDGWRVELPRNHSLDVKPEAEQEPASLAASNANAWPIRLEHGGRWVSIQPGERVILLGGAAPPPSSPAAPTPAPAPQPRPGQAEPLPELRAAVPPAEAAAQPATPAPPVSQDAGRVLRAGAAFSLERAAEGRRQVDRAAAEQLALQPGDTLETGDGELVLEVARGRVRLLPGSRLVISPPEGGPPLRLLRGEATVETEERITLGFELGEVGLLRGGAAVRVGDQEATLSLRQGTAGARFGLDVRVPLLPGCELRAVSAGGRLQLSAPTGSPALSPLLGSLEARLRPGQSVTFSRTGDLQVSELPGGRVELLGAVRASVVAGPAEVDQLELEDGRRFPIAGTLRFARRGAAIEAVGEPPLAAAPGPLAAAPPLAPDGPAAPAPTPPAAPQAPTGPGPAAPEAASPGGTERHVLQNGAVLFSRDWGQLQVKRQVGTEVEVEGPHGSLWFGANTRATLERLRGGKVRIDAGDGRFVDWEPGGLPLELRLQEDGRLLVGVDRGSLRRTIEVEAGCEFDLAVRPDHACAFVFGQVKYVEAGQAVSVTRRSGLRTQMAAGRAR